MRWQAIAALLGLLASAPAFAAEVPACLPQQGREVHFVAGEIAGANEFRQQIGAYTFALAPDPFGWNIRVFDAAGTDLTQLTPPYRFAPNAREIFGWHFRNQANTGSNDGSVNAPQARRLFLISPGVSGTGGFKPSTDAPTDPGANAAEGRGILTIRDFGLADLAPGQKARMVFLAFSACLSWPAPLATPIEAERLRACGLRPPYALNPYLAPAILEGDFDGDGIADIAGTVTRGTDGKNGLAICRGERTLALVGFEGRMDELVPEYFDRMDSWSLHPRGPAGQGANGKPPPVLTGDGILLGKAESSSVLLYWDGRRFWSYWQGD